jgi:hypothetical protein
MTTRSTWIEPGPDGRPHFVRKKTVSPPTKQPRSQVFRPRLGSARSLWSSFRDSRHNRLIADADADAENPLPLPAPDSAPKPEPPMAHIRQILPPSQSVTMYLLPPQPPQNPQDLKENNGPLPNAPRVANNIMTAPFLPGMFPISMRPFASQSPGLNSQPPPFPLQQSPFTLPTQPSTYAAAPAPGLLQGIPSQPTSGPATAPSSGAMRYRCEICGRYRSARYHYKHPIPPGQLPGRTICRKCQEEATDSDDTSSLDSYHEPRSRRRRGQKKSHRHRSRSRIQTRLIEDSRSRRHSPLSSESDSQSPTRSRDDRGRKYRRADTPGPVLVTETRRLRLSPLRDKNHRELEIMRYADTRLEESGPEHEDYTRARSRPRPIPDGHRILHRQYSNPFESIAAPEAGLGNGPGDFGLYKLPRAPEGYSPQRGPSPLWDRPMPFHPLPVAAAVAKTGQRNCYAHKEPKQHRRGRSVSSFGEHRIRERSRGDYRGKQWYCLLIRQF